MSVIFEWVSYVEVQWPLTKRVPNYYVALTKRKKSLSFLFSFFFFFFLGGILMTHLSNSGGLAPWIFLPCSITQKACCDNWETSVDVTCVCVFVRTELRNRLGSTFSHPRCACRSPKRFVCYTVTRTKLWQMAIKHILWDNRWAL